MLFFLLLFHFSTLFLNFIGNISEIQHMTTAKEITASNNRNRNTNINKSVHELRTTIINIHYKVMPTVVDSYLVSAFSNLLYVTPLGTIYNNKDINNKNKEIRKVDLSSKILQITAIDTNNKENTDNNKENTKKNKERLLVLTAQNLYLIEISNLIDLNIEVRVLAKLRCFCFSIHSSPPCESLSAADRDRVLVSVYDTKVVKLLSINLDTDPNNDLENNPDNNIRGAEVEQTFNYKWRHSLHVPPVIGSDNNSDISNSNNSKGSEIYLLNEHGVPCVLSVLFRDGVIAGVDIKKLDMKIEEVRQISFHKGVLYILRGGNEIQMCDTHNINNYNNKESKRHRRTDSIKLGDAEILKLQVFDNKMYALTQQGIDIYDLNKLDRINKIGRIDRINKIEYEVQDPEEVHLGFPHFVSGASDILLFDDKDINKNNINKNSIRINTIDEITDVVSYRDRLFVGADHLYSINNINKDNKSNKNNRKFALSTGTRIIQREPVLALKLIEDTLFVISGCDLLVYSVSELDLVLVLKHSENSRITCLDVLPFNSSNSNKHHILCLGTSSGSISVLKYHSSDSTVKRVSSIFAHSKEVTSLTLLNTDNQVSIASSSADRSLKITNISGKSVSSTKLKKSVYSVIILDRFIIAGSSDSNIYVYDYSTLNLIQKIEDHSTSVIKLMKVNGGFISSDLDGVIRKYALKNQVFKCVESFSVCGERVWSLFITNNSNNMNNNKSKESGGIGVGAADGSIYFLENITSEVNEKNKQILLKAKEQSFNLKILKDQKRYTEALDILLESVKPFERRSDSAYPVITFLSDHLPDLKERDQEISRVLLKRRDAARKVLGVLSGNTRFIEIFIFLLKVIEGKDGELLGGFKREVGKSYEVVENLWVDVLECEQYL